MFGDVLTSKSPSLDVHGETYDSVSLYVNQFVDDYYKLRYKYIVIIHGKGSYILKNFIHEYLKKDKRVDNYYLDINTGQTIVELKKNEYYVVMASGDVNLDNGKSTILMVEDNNNKNKVVGYAILHSMDKNDRIAIINDAGMEYDFREPFGFYLLRNITNSAKNIFDKVFTRRFPLGSLSSPEYEELGYSFISKEQNSRLDNEYPNESAQNPWLEKDLYN